MRIAFVDGGTYYHHATYHDSQFRPFFSRNIYICDLPGDPLKDVDCLYIASRQYAPDLIAARATIIDFLSRGGLLVVMGETGVEQWLDGASWHSGVTNFWWWLTPGADSGLRIADGNHGMFTFLSLADATWHRHGGLTPPAGARSLIEAEDDGCILYDAQLPGGGRTIVTTLDPCYHHGSYFMPATTRFIHGMLLWLKAGAPA